MRSNNCTHTRFNGIPEHGAGSYSHLSSYAAGHPGEPWVVSSMSNVSAAVLSEVFPFTGEEARQGQLERVGRAMDSPIWEMLHEFEELYLHQPKIAAAAYFSTSKRVTNIRELSILNFIIELKDIRKMFKLWDRSLSVIKNIASGILNVGFGWQPFLGDLVAILKALGNWRARVKTLLAEVHKMKRATYTVKPHKLPLVDEILITRTFPNPGDCGGRPDVTKPPSYELRLLVRRTPVVKCGMKYSLFCPELSEMQVKARGFCDAFGLRWDPAIIWNAIPFSFLIDWVWNVSSWLECRWAKPTLPVEFRLFDFYVQWKYTATVIIAIDVSSTKIDEVGLAVIVPDTMLIPINIERFCRRRITPLLEDLSHAGWSKSVLRKTLLGASLLVTNSKRALKQAKINRQKQRDIIRALQKRHDRKTNRDGYRRRTPYERWRDRRMQRERFQDRVNAIQRGLNRGRGRRVLH